MVEVRVKNLEKINHLGEYVIKMSRSKWKGLYTNITFIKKNCRQKTTHKITRNSFIAPAFLGLTFKIHNGNVHTKLTVTKLMINKKFGDFCFT